LNPYRFIVRTLLWLVLPAAMLVFAAPDRPLALRVGLKADDPWRSAAPHPFSGDRPAWSSDWYELSSGWRQSLLQFQLDTLGGHEVWAVFRPDGRQIGETLIPTRTSLWRRVELRNPRALGKALAEGSMATQTGTAEHIEIDIPFKVRSQTFRRIFGSGRIGLNVTGSIQLSGAYHTEKRDSESASALNTNTNDFRLDQQQQFTVVGKIGEKVDVHIDQDTQRSFDFENSLRITYTGEPEEVIESIEAGNISLSLPGTRYVSFSDRSGGLFGLKMVTRFGPLRMTGIASSEKNESKQQTFEGGTSTRNLILGPGEFQDNYFFVNEFYRHQYRVYDRDMQHLASPGAEITAFELYVFEPAQQNRWAQVKLVSPSGEDEFQGQTYSVRRVPWDPTQEAAEFDLDPVLGIITLKLRRTSNSFIAMAYAVRNPAELQSWHAQFGSGDGGFTSGTLQAGDGDEVVVLIPDHYGPDRLPYWDLQLRNIFMAGSADLRPEDFQLEIVQQRSGGSGTPSQNGVNYLRVLYLDVRDDSRNSPGSDNRVDSRWIDTATGMLSFPSPYPFGSRPDGFVLEYTGSSVLADSLASAGYPGAALYDGYSRMPNISSDGSNFDTVVSFAEAEIIDPIYDLRSRENTLWLDLNARYSLESEARMGTEVINLGWNVSSVTVTANGRRLTEGTDYTLEELSGLIRIINPAYTRADQKIVVSYETPQLFQLRKKTFMGVKADLDLWKTGTRTSRLGAAAIYYNEETAERKIRLGNEPIKNLVLDLNTELHFAPRLMTTWMDALPLIEADAPSSLNIEAEYAVVLPDPNPSNNPETGDNSGVAYVDDFESSKQEIPLSLSHGQWYLSSQPAGELLGHRGRLRWKNPQQKVPAREIWPEYQDSDREGVSNEVRVLRAHFEPFRLAGVAEGGSDPSGGPIARSRSWGGIYYDFRGAYDDFSEKKFLELTLRISGDHSGELNLDLGVIDEDVIPNGLLDTEDLNGDQILLSSEDIGLDGMAGADPPWPLPLELYSWSGGPEEMLADFGVIYDWWDINGNGIRDPHEPWSYDDYSAGDENDPSVGNAHGWEGNSQDADQRFPDTEDRNGNLVLDRANDYYNFRIPLNPADPDYRRYVSDSDQTQWIFVRIPLRDDAARSVGNPRLTVINGVRIWLTGFSDPVTVQIAELSIVGNEWREAIVADSDTSYHAVSVLNNFDNSEDYYPPPGVEGQKDLITGLQAREQSLVVELQDLPFGSIAWVRKQLMVPISLTEYRQLKMFVHGGDIDTAAYRSRFGEERLEFLMRIQSTEGNFYEYSKFIRAGWDPANDVRIIFEEITGLQPFLGASRDQEEPDKPVLLSDGGQVRVEGNPSINQVRSLLFGVKNHGSDPASTQIWFNELRVSDVRKEIGRAFRVAGRADFSDVLSLSSSFEQTDAEYHTVKERVRRTGNEEFKRSYSVSGSTDLGRLFPPGLGLSARLQADASHDYRLPKYYPNDDQEVDPDDHPEWVETVSRSRGATLNLRKSNSTSGWARHTLDRIGFQTSLSETVRRDRRIEADTTVRQTFSLDYGNNFNWQHRLKPLAFAEGWPLAGRVSGLAIGYVPTSLSLRASTDRTLRHQYNRDLSQVHSETYALNRSWSTSLPLVNDLTLSLGRTYANNLLFARNQARVPTQPATDNQALIDLWEDFSRRLETWREQEATLFDGDHRITQSVDFSYRPTLLAWLTTDFGYNTRYGWSRDLATPANGVTLSNDGSFRADLKLKPTKLAQTLTWMSDAALNEAKREITERKQQRAAARDERKAERQRLKEEREALGEGAEDAPGEPDGEAPAGEAVPDPVTPPPAGEAVPDPVTPPPAGEVAPDPATPLPAGLDPAGPELQPPAGMSRVEWPPDSLDGPRQAIVARPPGSELERALEGLPDSLRQQLSIADSLLRAGGMPVSRQTPADSLDAGEPGLDTEDAAREPSRLLATVAELLRRARQRSVVATGALEEITINFKRTTTRTDPGMAVLPWTPLSSRHASLPYQLALSQDPGLDTLRIGNLFYRAQRSFGYDYNLGTRLNLIPAAPIRLKYAYTFNQSFTNEREDSRRERFTGWYSFDNEKLLGKGDFDEGGLVGGNPSLLALPDYGISLQGLHKLPLVRNWVKSLTLRHEYAGALDVSYSSGTAGMVRSGLAHTKNFTPLTGFDFQLDKGWGGALNYNVRRTLRVQDPEGSQRGINYEVRREWTLSGSKALRKGFQIPGIRKRFDNETTLRLTYRNSSAEQINSLRGANEEGRLVWNTPIPQKDWSVQASADFRFSRNVTGGASWEYGVRRSGAANDRTSYMDFGVNCRIQIRSR
jgi:hypothetical protein